jgi:hypothetical protein
MATQDLSGDYPGALDRSSRRGSILRILAIVAGILALAVACLLTGSERAEALVVVLLGILSAIGIFALLAAATGIIRLAGDDPRLAVFRAVLDDATDGIA